jgi:hypothetical protein
MQSRKTTVLCSLLVFASCIIVSCTTETQRTQNFYNIDSLIAVQVDLLLARKAGLNKKASLNNVEKVTTTVPAGVSQWKNELDIFMELDAINKPMNKESYKVDTYADPRSNLKVKSFKTELDLPVKYLLVYYHQTLKDVRKIEAEYNETNTLYSSSRFLTMEFQNISDQTIVTSYSVNGGQKMFLDDSVEYKINATIILKE